MISFRKMGLGGLLALAATVPALGQVVTPSHAPGFHAAPFDLTLTASVPGAVIHYTLDGTIPNAGSPVHNAPLPVTTPAVLRYATIPTNHNVRADEAWRAPQGTTYRGLALRARARNTDGSWGPTASFSYFIDAAGHQRYAGHPVVSIITEPDHFFSADSGIYVPGRCVSNPGLSCNYFYWDGEAGERQVHVEFFETDGTLAFAQNAGVRLHGNTTVSRPVKSMRLYGRAIEGSPNRFTHQIFKDKPVTEYRRVMLRNSGNDWDQSYLRDGFQQTLIHGAYPGVQRYRPAVVFLNGEYWGIHNLRDRYDDHYLGTNFGVDRDNIVILENNALLDEGEPGDEAHYQQLIQLVSTQNPADAGVWAQIEQKMDVWDFADFMLAHIHFRNTDWPGNNVRFWRVKKSYDPNTSNRFDDGRWRWLVFDSDFGYDLQFDYVPGLNQGWNHNTLAMALDANGPSWPNPEWSTRLLRRLLLNPDFKRAFITRYAAQLDVRFAPERVTQVLDSLAGRIRPLMPEHIARWGGNESMPEWEGHIDRLRTFGTNRAAAQRAHLSAVFPEHPRWHEVTVEVVEQSIPTTQLHDGEWDFLRLHIGGETIRSNRTFLVPEGLDWQIDAGYTLPPESMISYHWEVDGVSHNTGTRFEHRITKPTRIRLTAVIGSSVDEEPHQSPRETALLAPWPNPFNPSSVIRYQLTVDSKIRLSVHDLLGREVALLVDGTMPAGTHSATFNGRGLASGIYVVRLVAGGVVDSRRVTLLK